MLLAVVSLNHTSLVALSTMTKTGVEFGVFVRYWWNVTGDADALRTQTLGLFLF